MKKRQIGSNSKAPAGVDQDIVGLITTLVEKLVTLEGKIDTVLSRIPTRPSEPPRQQQVPAAFTNRPRETRPMYKAICADCGKNCEVPFRPSNNRSVYCKDCYARRRNNDTFAQYGDGRPKDVSPAFSQPPKKPQAVKPEASARRKKAPAKKSKKKKT